MIQETKSITILMMDDDPEDRLLAEGVFEKAQLDNNLRFVEDGYELSVNSFITKPVTFDGLVDINKILIKCWFEIVALPPGNNGDSHE